jgi:hypothetical protein
MVNTGSILGNSYNNKDYGTDINENSTISVAPAASDLYDEATTDDPDEIKRKERLNNLMYDLFTESPWVEKYGGNDKKVEKKDIEKVYTYFHHLIVDINGYNELEAICTIAEFFQMNYKTIYSDVLGEKQKSNLMKLLKEQYGLSKEIRATHKMF